MRTARKGAAAKAGHDLVIEVTSWSATLELADDPAQSSLELDADAGSLKVREGTGGVMELGDDDRREIEQNIDDEVLGRHPVEFRSTAVEGDGDRLRVRGDLTLAQRTNPVEFELSLGRRRRDQRLRDADARATGASSRTRPCSARSRSPTR